jgi:hypothetical protein
MIGFCESGQQQKGGHKQQKGGHSSILAISIHSVRCRVASPGHDEPDLGNPHVRIGGSLE